MINLFASGRGFRRLAAKESPGLTARFNLIPYESLAGRCWVRGGTSVFMDIESLDSLTGPVAEATYKSLARQTGPENILNRPALAMGRYELLRTLFERGSNAGEVFRVTEHRAPTTYPVYVQDGSTGTAVTEALNSARELSESLASLGARADLFRGNLLIRSHLVPGASVGQPTHSAYLLKGQLISNQDAHAGYSDVLREVAQLAGMDCGRIDFSIRSDGGLEVEGIDTGPFPPADPSAVRFYTEVLALEDRRRLHLPILLPIRPKARKAAFGLLHWIGTLPKGQTHFKPWILRAVNWFRRLADSRGPSK